jgi:hypothetical protein
MGLKKLFASGGIPEEESLFFLAPWIDTGKKGKEE